MLQHGCRVRSHVASQPPLLFLLLSTMVQCSLAQLAARISSLLPTSSAVFVSPTFSSSIHLELFATQRQPSATSRRYNNNIKTFPPGLVFTFCVHNIVLTESSFRPRTKTPGKCFAAAKGTSPLPGTILFLNVHVIVYVFCF